MHEDREADGHAATERRVLLQVPPQRLVCYLRHGDKVFETYWTTICGVEAMDYSLALMDLTVYGRQEPWEDSPPAGRNRGNLMRAAPPLAGACCWRPGRRFDW